MCVCVCACAPAQFITAAEGYNRFNDTDCIGAHCKNGNIAFVTMCFSMVSIVHCCNCSCAQQEYLKLLLLQVFYFLFFIFYFLCLFFMFIFYVYFLCLFSDVSYEE